MVKRKQKEKYNTSVYAAAPDLDSLRLAFVAAAHPGNLELG